MNDSSANTDRDWTWLVFLVAMTVFLGAIWAWSSASQTSFADVPPHWNIDGIFYDNIAYNLAGGKGFVVDFEDETWRKAYEQADVKSGPNRFYKWVMQFEGRGPTTMRSPGYPIVLSLIYRCFGWNFKSARYAGMLFTSLGLAVVVGWCFRRWGILVAMLATLTLLVDFSVMQTSSMIASESLAVLMFSLSFVALAALLNQPNYFRAICCGLSFAGLFLTRGNWNLGLLLIMLMSSGLASARIRQWLKTLTYRHILLALLVAMAVAAPWWIRNCRVINQFQPFGSAGACGLVAAYCDESLADYGNWKAGVFHRNQQSVFEKIDFENTSLAEREFLVGQSSVAKAKSWAVTHWLRLPELAVYRYLSHWGLFNRDVPVLFQIANAIWLIFGLTGCLFLSGKQRKLFVVVLLLDALIVMLTWAHLGRYGIPIRPVLHVGGAILIVRFWQHVLFERGEPIA